MTTAERTIWMYNQLPATDQARANVLIKKLFDKRETGPEVNMKQISKKDFLQMLDRNNEEHAKGNCYTLEEVDREICAKYGL